MDKLYHIEYLWRLNKWKRGQQVWGIPTSLVVVAYFFPGASKTKPDGSDRFRTDMMRVRETWKIPFVELNPIELTQQEANEINLQQ